MGSLSAYIKGDEFDRGTCIGGSGANFSDHNNVGRCDVAGEWMEFDFFPPAPTLSEWGVVLLVMTLLTMGVVVVRRRLRVS